MPISEAVRIHDDEVVSWYFRDRLGQEVPVALDAWAAANGWRRVTDLLRALRAEWSFEVAGGDVLRP